MKKKKKTKYSYARAAKKIPSSGTGRYGYARSVEPKTIIRYRLLKEIDAMVASADKKRKRMEQTYTIACNKLHNDLPGPCVIILKGKRKLRHKLEGGSKYPKQVSFSHYISSKHYVGILMLDHFEEMFDVKIKPGRYRYMTGDFKFSKNKIPKEKK